MTIWVVRAGRRGETEIRSLEEGRAFIRWSGFDDFSKYETREKICAMLEDSSLDLTPISRGIQASQIFNFVKVIKIGDIIAIPLKSQPAIAFGTVDGEYEYLPDHPRGARHSRRVKWIGDPKPRNIIPKDILKSFGGMATVFRVDKNDAERRLQSVICESKMPNPTPIKAEDDSPGTETDNLEPEPDLKLIARDRISDFIGHHFKEQRMEELVAEVLKAQGFEVRENQKRGADGGVDILAGREAMGFGKPHLCVQVKSGDSPIDSKTYDELKGVMKKFNATQGLFVSWGGFKRTVEEEAKRDFFNIRLWNAETLVNKIQDVYPKLPKHMQAKLPIQQIWVLIEQEQD